MDCSTPGFPAPYHKNTIFILHSDSCPLNQWCHLAISFSDTLFSYCPQSFPASGTFLMSQLLASGDQNTRTSASASVFPMNIQGRFPLGLTGLILLSKGLSDIFSSITLQRHQFFGTLPSLRSALTTVRDCWENHHLDNMDLCWQSDVSTLQHTV